MNRRLWLLVFALVATGSAGSGCAKGYIMVTCSPCKGSGKVKCPKCDAQGLAACAACRGWGFPCCAACGQNPQKKSCERCKAQLPNCATCKGTAQEDCPLCEKGVKRDGQNCGVCRAKGTFDCRNRGCVEGKERPCVCCSSPPKAEYKVGVQLCVPCAGKAVATCVSCAGAIHISCARCGGTGKFKSQTRSGGFSGRDWD